MQTTHAAAPVAITFYYPTAVGGPITKAMDGYAAAFNKANPDIKVTSAYAGGYPDVYNKIQTEVSGGQQTADVSIMLSTHLYSLVDNHLTVPLDHLVKASANRDA